MFIEEEKKSFKDTQKKPLVIDKEEVKQSEIANSDKYYKKFDFFYKRTCFRLMAEFYKLTFQPY